MNMRNISWLFLAIIFFAVLGAILYIIAVIEGTIETTVVTWIILITASLLHLTIVVLEEGIPKLSLHIVIIVGTLSQIAIFGFVLKSGASTEFTSLDGYILAVAFSGFLFYLWKRKYAIVSAIAINMAIVIGFIPMWVHLSNGGVTESFLGWTCITIATTLGCYTPFMQGKHLALIYPLRATLTSGSVVVLTLWNMIH